MKPLQPIALGYVLIALRSNTGFDLFPDPLGWLLILGGLTLMPPDLNRPLLRQLAALALVVAIPLWFPSAAEALGREDPSLGWAADLPGFAFVALLFHTLGEAASAARDRWAGHLFRALVTATLVIAFLPVLVFGARWSEAGAPADAAAALLRLVTVAVLLSYAGRSWARSPIVVSPAEASCESPTPEPDASA